MHHRARFAACTLLATVASACAGVGGLPESPSAVPTETVLAGASVAAPPVGADTAAMQAAARPAPEPALPLAPTVELVQPDFVVDAGVDLDDVAISAIRALPGLEHAAEVARHSVRLSGPAADMTADVMVVDPADFRPMTPEVTAQSVGVWERLAAGDVVVRHDIGSELGLELGGTLLLATDEGSKVARVGAMAANGTPPVAAVLIPWSLAEELGITSPNGFVLAVGDDQIGSVEDALGTTLDHATVERREPPREQVATVASGSSSLEAFSYTDFGDGSIAIDGAWVDRHIRTVTLPGIATTRCHELMIPQLLAALDEVRALGLYDHFKPEQFGGCWVPRHIDWDPTKPLSNHAWGIAVDLNTHDNWLGATPMMDMRIVEVFERWGFEWGGRWRRPDGMHFELARIVRPAEA